ncbi:MAG: ribonuclease HI [Candidatus Nitrohelix vancouverensis]|uniref:Ribonuclease H n=1 Tax=Candidatus Nitrohelix vancouverensis TaxID=2705534 RepID=A0A7T0G311_9BACT|nr:MAG: ribonuclease HI [Candidatus Nitrohelix vancouverensis]
MKEVEIFTDGACKGNPGPGGYGCILRYEGRSKELKGNSRQTTNNIMEMMAAIVALQELKEPCKVSLTTDSQYLVKGATEWLAGWKRKGWKTASRQPIKNKELWEEVSRLIDMHEITWLWTRGHSGHPENERCDQLANEAILSLR